MDSAPLSADSSLLSQIQNFLLQRGRGLPPNDEQEAAWATFYDSYCGKIRKYAFSCGATQGEIADCVQEVWAELLVRLPTFQLDPSRGKFDSWLFPIVRAKVADLLRLKHRLCQVRVDAPETAMQPRSSPTRDLEHEELLDAAWTQARAKLSECTFQVLKNALTGPTARR